MKRSGSLLDLPVGVRQKVVDFVGPKRLVPLRIKIHRFRRLFLMQAPEGGDIQVDYHNTPHLCHTHEEGKKKKWVVAKSVYVAETAIVPFLVNHLFDEDSSYDCFPVLNYEGTDLRWWVHVPENADEAQVKDCIAKILKTSLVFLGKIRVADQDQRKPVAEVEGEAEAEVAVEPEQI